MMVFDAVDECGRDHRPAVPNGLEVGGGRGRVTLVDPAEHQEVARVRGVARRPVQAVAQARVAGALVDRDPRLPQPGRLPVLTDDQVGQMTPTLTVVPGFGVAWPTAPL